MSHSFCNLEIWNGIYDRRTFQDGIDLDEAMDKYTEYRLRAIRRAVKHSNGYILYCVIQYNFDLDTITTVSYFNNTILSYDELAELMRKLPDAEFSAIDIATGREICRTELSVEESKCIRPITLKEANAFVVKHHRHHDSVTGCKFAVSLHATVDGDDKIIGVAICGRPVSRHLDDGMTLEINRLCVLEAGVSDNGCSMLYSACIRIAKEMGYKKVITYILKSENGASLKASGFTLEDDNCGGIEWRGKRSKSLGAKKPPLELKQRWVKLLY